MSDNWQKEIEDIFEETKDMRTNILQKLVRYRAILQKQGCSIDLAIASAELELKEINQIENNIHQRKMRKVAQLEADREVARFGKVMDKAVAAFPVKK